MDHLRIATANPSAAPALRRLPRRLRAVPDAELVARVRAGDVAAFEAIYDRYHRPLLGFCRHMLGSQPDAEDALQHVFIAADRTLRADARPVHLKPWLYAVASNRCTSVLRARREHVALDSVPEPSTAGLALAEKVERSEDLKLLLSDVAALPDAQRAALVLAELGDLTHEEIAESLDVRTEKVKALVFQARESLVGSRRARDTDCVEIREQLATLRGGALRRTSITRHVAVCPACAAFRADLRTQRAALGCVLPVVPALMLKQQILGAVLAGGSGTAAAAGLTAAGAGATGGAAAGVGATGVAGTGAAASGAAGAAAGSAAVVSVTTAGGVGIATKALAALVLAGGVAGGGVAIERQQRPAPPRVERAPARAAPAGVVVPAPKALSPARSSSSATPTGAPSRAGTRAQRKAAARLARAIAKSKRLAAKQSRERGRSASPAAASEAAAERSARSKPGRAAKPGRAPKAAQPGVTAPGSKPARSKPARSKPAVSEPARSKPEPAAPNPERTPKPRAPADRPAQSPASDPTTP